MLRIAITGPESTGKSTLAAGLAAHFNTVWVPEYAREYIAGLQRGYTLADLGIIAKKQLELEEEMAALASGILFCDTDLFVIKVWAENAFGTCPAWIVEALKTRRYDLHLVPDIDLPWQPDPQREHPHLRQYFIDLYKKELTEAGVKWQLVSGSEDERLQRAILVLQEHIPELKM